MTAIEMTAIEVTVALALGLAGAVWHLLATRWRCRLTVSGRARRGLLLLPLGFVGPALSILGAARLSHATAWVAAVALLVTHRLSLALLRHQLQGSGELRGSSELPEEAP